MKKLLIVSLAVFCLFAAVSCKDDNIVEKINKLPVMYTDPDFAETTEEGFIIGEIARSCFGSLTTICNTKSKDVTVVLSGLDSNNDDAEVDGKLHFYYDSDNEKILGTFDGSYDGVEAPDDEFSLVESDYKYVVNGVTFSDELKGIIEKLFNQVYKHGNLPSSIDTTVDIEIVESVESEAIAVFKNDITIAEQFDGKTYQIIGENSKITVNSNYDYEYPELRKSIESFNPEFCVTEDYSSLITTFNINAEYKVGETTKPIHATVTMYVSMKGCTTSNALCFTVNYNGKDYLLNISDK